MHHKFQIKEDQAGEAARLTLDAAQASQLDADLLGMHQALHVPEEEEARRQGVLKRLENSLKAVFPTCRLQLFGSTANTLGSVTSDLDLCLVVDPPPPCPDPEKRAEHVRKYEADVVSQAGALFETDPANREVKAITTCRVPIVKLVDTETGIACDLCVNNELAAHNTALIRTYMQLSPESRQLTLAVRRWAKARGVADPTNATLTSYAWGLLAINAAQTSTPPCVPNLQQLPVPERKSVPDYRSNRECDVTFCTDHEQAKEWLEGARGALPPCRASGLLAHFFWRTRYGTGLCSHVHSVRHGGAILRDEASESEVAASGARRSVRWRLCVEDPFENGHDLGSVIYDVEGQARISLFNFLTL